MKLRLLQPPTLETKRAATAPSKILRSIARPFYQMGRGKGYGKLLQGEQRFIREQCGLTDGEWAVYSALLSMRNASTFHTHEVSYALIAQQACRSKDSTRKLIERLVRKGAIRKEKGVMHRQWSTYGFELAALYHGGCKLAPKEEPEA